MVLGTITYVWKVVRNPYSGKFIHKVINLQAISKLCKTDLKSYLLGTSVSPQKDSVGKEPETRLLQNVMGPRTTKSKMFPITFPHNVKKYVRFMPPEDM